MSETTKIGIMTEQSDDVPVVPVWSKEKKEEKSEEVPPTEEDKVSEDEEEEVDEKDDEEEGEEEEEEEEEDDEEEEEEPETEVPEPKTEVPKPEPAKEDTKPKLLEVVKPKFVIPEPKKGKSDKVVIPKDNQKVKGKGKPISGGATPIYVNSAPVQKDKPKCEFFMLGSDEDPFAILAGVLCNCVLTGIKHVALKTEEELVDGINAEIKKEPEKGHKKYIIILSPVDLKKIKVAKNITVVLVATPESLIEPNVFSLSETRDTMDSRCGYLDRIIAFFQDTFPSMELNESVGKSFEGLMREDEVLNFALEHMNNVVCGKGFVESCGESCQIANLRSCFDAVSKFYLNGGDKFIKSLHLCTTLFVLYLLQLFVKSVDGKVLTQIKSAEKFLKHIEPWRNLCVRTSKQAPLRKFFSMYMETHDPTRKAEMDAFSKGVAIRCVEKKPCLVEVFTMNLQPALYFSEFEEGTYYYTGDYVDGKNMKYKNFYFKCYVAREGRVKRVPVEDKSAKKEKAEKSKSTKIEA